MDDVPAGRGGTNRATAAPFGMMNASTRGSLPRFCSSRHDWPIVTISPPDANFLGNSCWDLHLLIFARAKFVAVTYFLHDGQFDGSSVFIGTWVSLNNDIF